VLDHHLHKGIACVAHFSPCYDNFIVPLSPQLEPELAELITMGGQMGNTSEGQPRGIDKEGKHGEPLIFKEGCHENHEVNCDPPPRFDELEIEELQVSDLELCGVVKGIEELLSQEECPHA